MRAVIVVYDISDDKTRRHISNYLKDIGLERIQLSVFAGHIRDRRAKTIVGDLNKKINGEDKIHIIYLKNLNIETVISLGDASITKYQDVYIF